MSTPAPLEGRVALVTGAAVRLGAAIATRLAQAGADVVAHHHASHEAALELVPRLEKLGSRAWSVEADLTEAGSAERIVDEARRLGGRLDILVNSAAIFPPGDLASTTSDALRRVMDLNAWAPLALTRAFADGAEEGACIVNVLDTRIHRYDRDRFAYNLSKRTLAWITRQSALELAPRVRVNAVAPGAILPPPGEDFDYLARVADARVPLGRPGAPSDVAEAILFLASSPFVTGVILDVDGGEHLRGSSNHD